MFDSTKIDQSDVNLMNSTQSLTRAIKNLENVLIFEQKRRPNLIEKTERIRTMQKQKRCRYKFSEFEMNH